MRKAAFRTPEVIIDKFRCRKIRSKGLTGDDDVAYPRFRNGIPGKALAFVAALVVSITLSIPGTARADDAAANALFVDAVRTYRAAAALEGDERMAALRSVRAALDRVLADYPDSAVAQRLRVEPQPAGIDLAALPAAAPQSPEDCIAAGLGEPPPEDMQMLAAFDAAGMLTGIPILERPVEADATIRAQFLAMTAAVDACAPFEVAQGATEVRILARPDGSVGWSLAPAPEVATAPVVATLGPATEAEEDALGLDRQDIRDLQARLLVSGFDPNGVDGVIGGGTRAALRDWQQSIGLAPTGFLNAAQRAALTARSDAALAAWRADPDNERLYTPPDPIALGPRNVAGTWRFTSTCGPNSRLGNLRITGVLDLRHAGGNSYSGTARQSQGFRGQFSGRLEGRQVIARINWGLLIGRVDVTGRIADQELVMRGRDSNGCSFHAARG